jgi:small ubiquitin-related modifier
MAPPSSMEAAPASSTGGKERREKRPVVQVVGSCVGRGMAGRRSKRSSCEGGREEGAGPVQVHDACLLTLVERGHGLVDMVAKHLTAVADVCALSTACTQVHGALSTADVVVEIVLREGCDKARDATSEDSDRMRPGDPYGECDDLRGLFEVKTVDGFVSGEFHKLWSRRSYFFDYQEMSPSIQTRALERCSPAYAAVAGDVIVSFLKHEHIAVQVAAAHAICRLAGALAPHHLSGVVALATSEAQHFATRVAALATLAMLKVDKQQSVCHARAIRQCIESPEPTPGDAEDREQQLEQYTLVKTAAIRALGHIGDSGEAHMDVLLRMLQSAEKRSREACCSAFENLGQHAMSALPNIADLAAEHQDEHIRAIMVKTLGLMRQHSTEYVGVVHDRLGDQSDEVRCQAIHAMHKIGDCAVQYLGDIVGCLADNIPEIRQAAKNALKVLCAHCGPHLGTIFQHMKNADEEIALDSISAVGAIARQGLESALCVSRMISCLDDTRPTAMLRYGYLDDNTCPDYRYTLAFHVAKLLIKVKDCVQLEHVHKLVEMLTLWTSREEAVPCAAVAAMQIMCVLDSGLMQRYGDVLVDALFRLQQYQLLEIGTRPRLWEPSLQRSMASYVAKALLAHKGALSPSQLKQITACLSRRHCTYSAIIALHLLRELGSRALPYISSIVTFLGPWIDQMFPQHRSWYADDWLDAAGQLVRTFQALQQYVQTDHIAAIATKLRSKSSIVRKTALEIFTTYSISVLLPHVSIIDKCMTDSDSSVRLAALRVVEKSRGTWEHFDGDKVVSLLEEDDDFTFRLSAWDRHLSPFRISKHSVASRILAHFSSEGWLPTQRLFSLLFKSRRIFEPRGNFGQQCAAFEAFRPGARRYFSSLSADEIVAWMCARVEGQDLDLVRTQFGVQFQEPHLRSGPRCVTTKSDLVAAARRWLESHASALIVSLKVRGQDGTEVFFKIRRISPLQKLMNVYAQRQGGTPSAYRFIFNGNRIVETQTPDDLDMENDDVIDAMLEQVGSDRRLKHHIEPAGVSPTGLPQYTWNYRDGYGFDTTSRCVCETNRPCALGQCAFVPSQCVVGTLRAVLDDIRRYFGTMAQDLLLHGRGDAVVRTSGGWLAVRYGRIDIAFHAV